MSVAHARRAAVVVLAGCLVVTGAVTAAAQATIVLEQGQIPLGPTPDGGAILADTLARFVFTPSPRMGVPQGGLWVLDWDGSANLAAGHYEGHWSGNAYVQSLTFDESGVIHLVVPAHLTFVMPGHGTVIAKVVNFQTGACGLTPTFVQVWRYSRLRGTGVFSGLTDLSGEAVAVLERSCAPAP